MSSKEAAADAPEVAVAEPEQKRKPKPRKKPPRRQPRYHVILWNDDDHTYEYVIEMMQKLFGHTAEQGYKIAKEVDSQGKAICLTTTREHAELKADQIHAYGKDGVIISALEECLTVQGYAYRGAWRCSRLASMGCRESTSRRPSGCAWKC